MIITLPSKTALVIVKDGCIYNRESNEYKDSRYISLHSSNNNTIKTNLFTVEKENQVEEILKRIPIFSEETQEKKKLIEISFWARPVLKYDGTTCAITSKDEVVKMIKNNRGIGKETDFND